MEAAMSSEGSDVSLRVRIREDLNAARRERDKKKTTLLTTMLSDVKNQEIELGHELTDAEVTDVLTRGIKRRREAAEQMRAGKRIDLAEIEESEIELLSVYLPPALSEDEVRAMVREARSAGADNVGAVMKAISPRLKGRFDGKEANRIVREEIG
jgi:uncharacterized protein